MARGIQPITKMINEKEMTKLGNIEAEKAAQRNRNIFGDSSEEGLPITTIYTNFIEEIYRV